MNKPKMLIKSSRIRKKVADLAKRISKDYSGKSLVLIGVLKGSFIFLADLARSLSIPASIDFVQAASYGKGTTPAAELGLRKDIDLDIKDRHVLIVEDIVDFGYTVKFLAEHFKKLEAASVKVCALLDKPSRRKADVSIEYRGFEVPDKFIVGYGMDYGEEFRNLKDIRSIAA